MREDGSRNLYYHEYISTPLISLIITGFIPSYNKYNNTVKVIDSKITTPIKFKQGDAKFCIEHVGDGEDLVSTFGLYFNNIGEVITPTTAFDDLVQTQLTQWGCLLRKCVDEYCRLEQTI